MGVVDVAILDPNGRRDTVRPMVNKKNPELWYVDYTPQQEGQHSVNISFAGGPIPTSPYPVAVSAGKLTDCCKIQVKYKGKTQ